MNFDRKQDSLQELGYLLAEAAKNVVFVVGAGLSRPAGLPGWVELVDKLRSAVVAHATETLPPDAKNNLLERIEESKDLWIRTKLIRRALPPEKFEGVVKAALTPKSESLANRADSYKRIWKLNPSGMISLNLDSLAAGASAEIVQTTALHPEKFNSFLLSTRPFLFQPHGEIRAPSSWVLDIDSRNNLLGATPYRRFMSSLLTSKRLVFIGVGPRDIALEALLLDDFRSQMNATGLNHFWITDQTGADDTEWAASFSIKQINFARGKHEAVGEIIDHLASFRPRALAAAPLAYEGDALDPSELPPDEELMRQSIEDIRRKLNAALAFLRSADAADSYRDSIGSFLRNYPKSIRLAWTVGDDNPATRLLWGTTVQRHIGLGAFANVWEVTDVVDGTKLAVKVLHEQVLRSDGFIDAFRNGVQAMRILNRHSVAGMCRIRDAFDIPSCIVMEYIEGPNLEKLVSEHWTTLTLVQRIKIVRTVAEIVQRGHNLPEAVLHRDLKPANVMLRDYWLPNTEAEVIVLDFDLSWYEGAMGRSMVAGAAKLHNYIAPEQQEETEYSRRHTAVDVFGITMLLFYVAMGKHPLINEQERASFREDIIRGTHQYSLRFPGLSELLADLIVAGANRAQDARPGLQTMIERLRVVETLLASSAVDVGPVLICSLVSQLKEQGWSLESPLAWFDTTGARLRMGPCEMELELVSGGQVRIHFVGSETGTAERRNIGKFLKKRGQESAGALAHSKLVARAEHSAGQGSTQVEALTQLSSTVSAADARALAGIIDTAGRKLAFAG